MPNASVHIVLKKTQLIRVLKSASAKAIGEEWAVSVDGRGRIGGGGSSCNRRSDWGGVWYFKYGKVVLNVKKENLRITQLESTAATERDRNSKNSASVNP